MTTTPFVILSDQEREALVSTPPYTVSEVVRARAGDPHLGLCFESEAWTYAEMVELAAQRAAVMATLRQSGPFHIAVLLENVPEANFWFAATALAGATLVPLNLTRRGNELAGDLARTDCQLLVTDGQHLDLLAGADEFPIARDRVLDIGSEGYRALLEQHRGADLPELVTEPGDTFLLGFTSGTTSGPKACIFTHNRLVARARAMSGICQLGPADVVYEVMPLFHNSGIAGAWLPGWVNGATQVMRRRFSASGFLPDVRRFGITYFPYIGKVLSYILETPEAPDDADNTLIRALGVEASPPDIERFERRFGCAIRDAYGSTEGGITIHRDDRTPVSALGRPVSGTAKIVNPDTLEECAIARFDDRGRLLNPDEAVGEIVDEAGVQAFEGYYNNHAADRERVHDGLYWTGDRAFRDAEGYFYFAGRGSDMIRVDGENLGTAQIDAIHERWRVVKFAAAYAAPSMSGSDDLMMCLQLRDGESFDADAFAAFLGAQPDLSPKMVPRFVRVTQAMPLTASQKINRGALRKEGLASDDPIWWRRDRSERFEVLSRDDAQRLREEIQARGRDWSTVSTHDSPPNRD